MNFLVSSFWLSGLLFGLVLASGVWLSRSGKPLNTAIFTLHKLMALGTVIVMAIQVSGALKNLGVQTGLIAVAVVAIAAAISLFVTGALMSLRQPPYPSLLTLHNVGSVLAALGTVATLYLLYSGSSLLSLAP
jgi:hypothetical protein